MTKIKLWKYSGIFLMFTGTLHTIVALMLGANEYMEMVRDGLINTAAESFVREFAFWFFACGIFFILLGHTLHHYIKKEQKPAPIFVGYYLLFFSILGCVVEPISGIWLFIPQAFIIIFYNKIESR